MLNSNYIKIIFIIIASLFYLYLTVRAIRPDLVFHKSGVIKNAEMLTEKRDLTRQEAKNLFFKHIGKSEKMILIDQVMTNSKDLLKFSPILLGILKLDNRLYLGYFVPLVSYFVLTKAGKNLIKKTRPDSSNLKSFPSGHTASAFLGASFLYANFNPYIGIPLFGLATAVGISRVYCQRHTWVDVMAGALIGIFCGLYINRILGINKLLKL